MFRQLPATFTYRGSLESNSGPGKGVIVSAGSRRKSAILSRIRTPRRPKNDEKWNKNFLAPRGIDLGTFGMQKQSLTTALLDQL